MLCGLPNKITTTKPQRTKAKPENQTNVETQYFASCQTKSQNLAINYYNKLENRLQIGITNYNKLENE